MPRMNYEKSCPEGVTNYHHDLDCFHATFMVYFTLSGGMVFMAGSWAYAILMLESVVSAVQLNVA